MPLPEPKKAYPTDIDQALKRIGDCIRRRSPVLDLSKLDLTSLPPKIDQITKLAELDLSNNHFETLPAGLSRFRDLTRLNLSYNPIQSLSAEIGQFTKLTRLDITHTPLCEIPPEIGLLAGLTRLYLDGNRLTTLPHEISKLIQLTRLYVSGNSMNEFPTSVCQLEKLTRFDISNNQISRIPPEIGLLANLTVLDASNNPLGALPVEVGSLARLTVLHLSETGLETLPVETGDLANLTELDLTRNALIDLPDSLMRLEKLERLYVHGNPALQLSPSILGGEPSKGGETRVPSAKSILDFYFGRKSGTTGPLNEVRLVLLGPAGSGKTTIIQAVLDQPFREREPETTGVAICRWSLEGSGGDPVTFHVWDFSGQTITHSTHRRFFSPKNIYLVVLAGRNHQETEDADYWLGMIQDSASAQGSQPPSVIVALNQWNVPGSRPDVNRQAIRERFPFVRGFVEMDCKGKKGIPALKSVLFKELERMPWVREPFPTLWDEVRKVLATCKTFSNDSYREMCTEQGLTDAGQQDYLCEILQHLGVVLKSDDASILWNAGWLAKQVYPVIHRAEKQAGIFHLTDLETVLSTEREESTRISVMQALEDMSIAIAGQSAHGPFWLLPQAQPTTAPSGIGAFSDPEDSIRHQYVYQKSHHRLVAAIITRRFDFIEESREQKQQWRHGLILVRHGARALIQMDSTNQELTIIVTGKGKSRHQLADLCRAEIEELDGTAIPARD